MSMVRAYLLLKRAWYAVGETLAHDLQELRRLASAPDAGESMPSQLEILCDHELQPHNNSGTLDIVIEDAVEEAGRRGLPQAVDALDRARLALNRAIRAGIGRLRGDGPGQWNRARKRVRRALDEARVWAVRFHRLAAPREQDEGETNAVGGIRVRPETLKKIRDLRAKHPKAKPTELVKKARGNKQELFAALKIVDGAAQNRQN